MKQNILITAEIVGLLLIAAGILIPIITLDIRADLYKYIFSAGALLVLISRVMLPYRGENMRLRRLSRIGVFGALFFCVAAFFMFYNDPPQMRDPIVFVLAGGLIQIYTSIMMPRVAKNDKK